MQVSRDTGMYTPRMKRPVLAATGKENQRIYPAGIFPEKSPF